MPDARHSVHQLLKKDRRYPLEAYQFVREALSYAQELIAVDRGPGISSPPPRVAQQSEPERHLTGQQLCQAIRLYALDEFGYMAKTVLKSWGVKSTGDFGEIVYNLIKVGVMKKSETDRREDFDNVYEFDEAFCKGFQIKPTD
jgi:uncharacterized repeat protein (TIGR04138 family)